MIGNGVSWHFLEKPQVDGRSFPDARPGGRGGTRFVASPAKHDKLEACSLPTRTPLTSTLS